MGVVVQDDGKVRYLDSFPQSAATQRPAISTFIVYTLAPSDFTLSVPLTVLLAIIEKRLFLTGRPVSPWDGGKWINPETVATADRALAYGRPLRRRRRSDRHNTLICHGKVATPALDSAADNADGIPP
jgi:hypothetical protein